LGDEQQYFFRQKNRMIEMMEATALLKRTIRAVAENQAIDENDFKKLFLLVDKPFVWMGSDDERKEYLNLCLQNNNFAGKCIANILQQAPFPPVFLEKIVADEPSLRIPLLFYKDFLNALFSVDVKLGELASIAIQLKEKGLDIAAYKEALRKMSAFSDALVSSLLRQDVSDDLREKRDITAPAEDKLWGIIPATEILSIIASLQASIQAANTTPALVKIEKTLLEIKKSLKEDVKKHIALEERRSVAIFRKMSFFSDGSSSTSSTPRSFAGSFQP